MATIANMAVQLSANATSLTTGLQTAQKKLTQFTGFAVGSLDKGLVATTKDLFANLTSTIAQGLGSIPILGAPLAFVAGAIGGVVATGFELLSFLRKTWGTMKDLGKQAAGLGISVRDLSGLLFAAGPAGEAMFNSLNRMNISLGKARMGSKEAQAAFGRLGLDWKDLAQIPVAERFYRTADAIASIKDPSLQAAAAFGIFGKGVGPILFLLKQGSEGLKKFKDIAAQRGFLFDESDVAAAKQGAKALDELDRTFMGVKNAFAVAFSPIAAQFLLWVNEAAGKVGGFPELFKAMAQNAALFLGEVADAFAALVLRMDGFIASIEDVIGTLRKGLGYVQLFAMATLGPLTRGGSKGPAEGFKETTTTAEKAAASLSKLGNMLRGAMEKFQIIKAPDLNAGGLDEYVALWDKAGKVWEDIKSPLDKFTDKMNDLNDLLGAGILTWEDYGLASLKAVDELDKAQKMHAAGTPAALSQGSKEAYSAIAAFRSDRGDDAGRRLENILTQSKAIQERQARAAEATAEALQEIMVMGF
jgi:hypothetical protein